jgi:ADP-heptose:LPS heptosyltransferase
MSLLSRLSAAAYVAIFRARARHRAPQPRPIRLGDGSRVLVFTCAGIGDTLTDSVVFKALRETYPGIHLAAVVHRRRRLLLDHNPFVDQVFLFHKGPFAFRRLAAELRAGGPWDAILQLRGNDPEPRCLSFLLDPDVTVSTPNMTKLSWLCGHQVEQPDWDATHGVEQTLRLARHVGADTREPHLVYAVKDGERASLEARLRGSKIGARPRLVLQLGGGRRASWRDWPVTRYAELIRLAVAHLEAEIFVLGGPDQEERRQLLASLFGGGMVPYHDVVGKFTLAESAALLASARALVSTDTGIMHLGFAVGSRVGPYGYGDRHRVVQLVRPGNYQVPGDAAMDDISAAAVFEKLKEIWAP